MRMTMARIAARYARIRRNNSGLVGMATLVVLASLGASGCSPSASTASRGPDGAEHGGGVAVVDLQEVARRLGREAEMEKSIAQATTSLNEQLKQVRGQLQKQFDQQARELNEKAENEVAPASTGVNSSASNEQLVGLKRQYDQQLAQYDAQARDKLAKHKTTLIEQFRDQVRPVAQRVASQRGAGIVVTKNDAVIFATTPHADITEAVIAELQPKTVAETPAKTAE